MHLFSKKPQKNLHLTQKLHENCRTIVKKNQNIFRTS